MLRTSQPDSRATTVLYGSACNDWFTVLAVADSQEFVFLEVQLACGLG